MQLQTKVKDIPKLFLHFYYKQSPPSQTSRLPAGAREREKRERSQLAAQCLLQKVASTFSCRGYSLLHSYAQPQIRPNPHCIHGQTAEKAEERSLVAGSNPLSLSLSLSDLVIVMLSTACSVQHVHMPACLPPVHMHCFPAAVCTRGRRWRRLQWTRPAPRSASRCTPRSTRATIAGPESSPAAP